MSDLMTLARQKLPLRRYLEQYNYALHPTKSRGIPCPFCQNKSSASLKDFGGRQWFKCFKPTCISGTAGKGEAWDEVRFIAWKLGLNADNGGPGKYSDAALHYLKEAGVWTDKDRLPPSVMPGQRARKRPEPTPPQSPDEIASAKKPEPPPPSPLPREAVPPAETESEDEVFETASPATPGAAASGPAQPVLPLPITCNAKRGEPKVECAKPATWRHPRYPDGKFCDECKLKAEEFFPDNWLKLDAPQEALTKIANEDEAEGMRALIKKLKGKIGVAKAFSRDYSENQTKLDRIERLLADWAGEQKAVQKQKQSARLRQECEGFEALEDYYGRVKLTPADEKLLFDKRGFASATSLALGFKSSVPENREALLTLIDRHPWEEVLASGLWLAHDGTKPRRPNDQMCGLGILRKLARGDNYKATEDEWVDKDRNLWSRKACPVLIPYFDESGRLISLRPHKGGGRAGTLTGTPHVYVPRRAGLQSGENYFTVVITEGEFKAGALWQTVGGGRLDQREPYGVATLPGINFANHADIRAELEFWLKLVKCRRAIVAYDNEDKSHKDDRRKKFDAEIWARYLATDLAMKLQILGEVAVLPKEWRNAKGKADWDGALAMYAHGRGRSE